MSGAKLSVVLLGKTGTGKSSTGNTLLGRNAFRVQRGLCSGTEGCQWADSKKEDVHLKVIDTPGMCDTHRNPDNEKELTKEIGMSVLVTLPGPHIALMVVRGDAVFSYNELAVYQALKALFGDGIKDHMIVVFIGADEYGDNLKEQRSNLNEEVLKTDGPIKDILQDASYRFFCINNKASEPDRDKQATELISMMKSLVRKNEGRHFSSTMSNGVEKLVKPMVDRRMEQDNTSREEAEEETIIAIANDEEGDETFFNRLSNFIEEQVQPALTRVAGYCRNAANIAGSVGSISSLCSVM